MDVELQTFVGLSPIMPNDKRNSMIDLLFLLR